MRSYTLCVVLFMGLSAQAWKTEYTDVGRNEGDVCRRQADEVWTCKKDTDCEVLEDILRNDGILKTCSWKNKSPILCCPTKQNQNILQPTRSQQMCTEYTNSLCGNQNVFGVFSEAKQPVGSLSRRKRQVINLPNLGQNHVNVVGGQLSRLGEIPSMALIGYGDANAISWQCGGSLISRNFVLSAAHCVNPPFIGLARWVRLGDLDLNSNTDGRPQQLEIVERVVHPGYRSPSYNNDLALFRLARDVEFDNFVRPACLHSDIGDPSGVGTAAGWGRNASYGPRSSALMQVDISFVPVEECKRIIGVYKYLANGVDPATMVCAGELGKDTCQGDSGGPLLLRATSRSTSNCLASLVGVTSFGPRNCGVTEVPGVFVRVAHFRPWIESIVWPD